MRHGAKRSTGSHELGGSVVLIPIPGAADATMPFQDAHQSKQQSITEGAAKILNRTARLALERRMSMDAASKEQGAQGKSNNEISPLLSERGSNPYAPERNLPFPFKLYAMLEHAADSSYSSAVSWNADGRSFVIHDTDTFMRKVVPRNFKLLKFRSFVSSESVVSFILFALELLSECIHSYSYIFSANRNVS